MGAGRISCALLLVILVNMQLTAGKPFFDFLDLFSDDDYEEEEPADDDSDYDIFDMVFCFLGGSECTTRKPKTTTTTTTIKPETFFIPASLTGQNVTIGKRGGSWIIQFFPWLAEMTTPTSTTTAAPTTVAATTASTTVAAAAGNDTANATTPAA